MTRTMSTTMVALALVLVDPRRYLAFAVTQIAMIFGIVVVGLLDETRVMLASVPFIVLGFCVLRVTESARVINT